MEHIFETYCKDYKSIENYEKAAADNFKGWHCHHRREVDISRKELIALGLYLDRPAEELIFLTIAEHNSLHHKGKKLSEEHKKKLSKPKSDEHKKKLSEAHKGKKPMLGKHHSEETKNKLRETSRANSIGRHWYNNGKVSKRAYECPEGYSPGRLKRK